MSGYVARCDLVNVQHGTTAAVKPHPVPESHPEFRTPGVVGILTRHQVARAKHRLCTWGGRGCPVCGPAGDIGGRYRVETYGWDDEGRPQFILVDTEYVFRKRE